MVNIYEVFPRAKQLIRQGEIIGRINHGSMNSSDMKVPYVIANVSKMIVDVPAMFINRSLGNVLTTKQKEFEEYEENETVSIDELIEAKERQQEYINNIVENTNLIKWHSII